MWDKKYRPQRFSDVLGQPGTVTLLKARLKDGSAWEKSYLFCGGHGMGKTTLGRIMARAMLCQRLNPDDPEPCNECDNCKAFLNNGSQAFQERDAASQGKIDNIRAIVEELPFAVLDAPKRIHLFDECHRMSKDAQDVLLKPLEEKAMVGMFCTTEPEKVRGAIRSRCEEYMIRRATREEILAWVKQVLDKESVPHEDDAVLTVIDFTDGHLRDVLNRLEMIAQGGDVTVERVRDQLNLSLVSVFYEILLRVPGDLPGALVLLDRVRARVTAEEAANSLAEAAMNSFRLANGMSADFSFLDRDLAGQVSGQYGPQIVEVARHFLRSKYITYVGLTCDLATLSHSLGSGRVLTAPVVAPIAFTPLVAVAAPIAPVPTVEVSAPAVTPDPAPVPAATAVAQPSRGPIGAPQSAPKNRPYPGYIPSSAVADQALALTEHDGAVISRVAPNKTKSVPVSSDREGRTDLTPIAPEVWRQTFAKRRGVGG